jgi:ABC-type nitrate/sulfonate/bicarbonate transport system substrate-binding protein
MTKAQRQRALALLGAAALIVGACSGGGAATSAPTAAPTSASSDAPAVSADPAALPTPEKTDIRIGLSVTETSQFAAKLAELAGIYEKNGLNAEVTVFEGDGKVMQALQAGQLDVGFGGVSAYVTSQGTDVPVVALAVNARILSDLLVTTADVTSPSPPMAGRRTAPSSCPCRHWASRPTTS